MDQKNKTAYACTSLAGLLLVCLFLLAFLAACKDNEDYRKELARRGITYAVPDFLVQAAMGNNESVELFINAKMDVNARDSAGYSAVMTAAIKGKTDTVRLLVERGADVNARNINGYTPLMQAANQGHFDTVKLLIEKGADVNAKSNEGFTALTIAAAAGKTDIAELLRKAGAK